MQNRVIYNNNGTDLSFKSYLSKVFIFIALGLLVSAGISFLVGSNYEIIFTVLKGYGTIAIFLPAILELVVAIYFSARLMTMSKQTAYLCYFLYAVLTGLSFSYIFAIYEFGEITFAFVSTTVLFICMAIVGNNTNVNLSRFSGYLFGGLLAIIISTLLNVFLFKSSTADLLISYAAIIIFLVLIAYDMQRLRDLYNSGLNDSELYEKLLIFGSFQLYLDFINVFLRVLQVFSRRSRD